LKLVSSSSQALITTIDGNEEDFLPFLSFGEGTHPFFFTYMWEDCTVLLDGTR
jgi:hypothetical protein